MELTAMKGFSGKHLNSIEKTSNLMSDISRMTANRPMLQPVIRAVEKMNQATT